MIITAIARLLKQENPSDPSGQWSVWDLMDATKYSESDVRLALSELCPDGGRFVGGTSQYLFSLTN